ncbi:MAG: alpha/beta hydrolase [Burkholderiaceae bacterium]
MTAIRILLLPGWQNPGSEHWQSRWERTYGYERVQQHDWMRPLRGAWASHFIDFGHCGHLNADSGLGDWPQGHALVTQLVGHDTDAQCAPTTRHQQEG